MLKLVRPKMIHHVLSSTQGNSILKIMLHCSIYRSVALADFKVPPEYDSGVTTRSFMFF